MQDRQRSGQKKGQPHCANKGGETQSVSPELRDERAPGGIRAIQADPSDFVNQRWPQYRH